MNGYGSIRSAGLSSKEAYDGIPAASTLRSYSWQTLDHTCCANVIDLFGRKPWILETTAGRLGDLTEEMRSRKDEKRITARRSS